LLCSVPLRQRERDRTDGKKQKQIKSASDKMRFDGGINLFFHWVLFVRLSSRIAKLHFGRTVLLLGRTEKRQAFS
jgi:hypothetical protein